LSKTQFILPINLSMLAQLDVALEPPRVSIGDHPQIQMRVFAIGVFGEHGLPLLRGLFGATQRIEGDTELHRRIARTGVTAQRGEIPRARQPSSPLCSLTRAIELRMGNSSWVFGNV
jgi:hypothetical protein